MLVTKDTAVLNAMAGLDRAAAEGQRQQRLEPLQQVEEQDRDEGEAQDAGGVVGPALLGVRVDPDDPVERASRRASASRW